MSIGLVVQRKDDLQPPLIIPADFSNVGIQLRAERGVVNKGIRISSLAQFINKYTVGLPKLGELGYYGIRELYNNAQPYGATTYPVRIVGDGTAIATSTVPRGSTLISPIANQSVWAKVEDGTNVDTLKITLQDDYSAPTATEVYDNLTNENLPENIDASSALGQVLFYGETLPEFTTGFVGPAKVTAIIGGGLVTSVTVNYGGKGYPSTGVQVRFTGGNSGSSEVDATGTATVVNGVITAITITDGGAGYTTVPTVIITPVPSILLEAETAPTDLTISAGQYGDPDPGKWANNFAYSFSSVPGNPRQRSYQNYQLVNNSYVAVGSPITLDSGSLVDGLNDAGSGSGFTYIPGEFDGSLPAGDGEVIALTGGADETAAPILSDYAGNLTAKTGLYAFIATPVSLITSIDAYALSGHQGIDYAFAANSFISSYKQGAIEVANSYLGDTIDTIANTASSNGVRWRDILKAQSYVCSYKGWIKVDNEKKGKISIPVHISEIGSGFLRKVFDETKLPSIAPAGQAAVISDIFSMDESTYIQQDLTYLTKTLGFNAVILEEGIGYYALTSRMMSTANKNYDIHKMRSINYLIDSFQKSLGFILQEANTPELRKRLISSIDFFLQDHYNRGMFDKFSGYNGAVQIKCDDDNNPQIAVQQRELYCQVSCRFVNIVETAFIFINNVDGNLNITT